MPNRIRKPKILMHRGQWLVFRGFLVSEKADTVEQAWANWVRMMEKLNFETLLAGDKNI